MRTYSREAFLEARRAWAEGDFGSEWQFYRQLAADRGFIYPPEGTKWDSCEDEEPSQRAIVYRAIADTPRALTEIIGQSHSWHDVVRKLMADVDRRREDADLEERQVAWDHREDPTPREATLSLKQILNRIAES